MELPHLGNNCALRECNMLDFLPVKCDACSKTFCIEHYKYDTHNCEFARNKDNQVPVCPICSEPVVGKRGELPDVAVSQHIDQYCKRNQSIKNLKTKETNLKACTVKSCKQKDLIYLECKDCRSKFCIKHRHPSDHSCPGPSMTNNLVDNWQSFKGSCSTSASSGYNVIKNKAQLLSKSGQAALNRLAGPKINQNNPLRGHMASNRSNNIVGERLQGNISEQDALAIALRESQQNSATQPQSQQSEEDAALARAIHESQLASNGRPGNTVNKDTCVLS